MNIEELKKEYPKLTAKVEDLDDIRSLVVIDENYSDPESDDTEDFDPDEFNYMVYIPEHIVDALGDEGLEKVAQSLDSSEKFDEFLISEEDLFGLYSDLDKVEIAKVVLSAMENELS